METKIPIVFDIDKTQEWLKHLNDEGYVVIKNILTSSEQKKGIDLFKEDWNTVSPKFDFNDTTDWSIKNSPMIFSKGQAVFNGFGQSNFMWYLRTNSVIKNIFEKIHNTKDLSVSFDGFSVFITNQQKSKPWLHVDQNPSNNIYSIQGSYNFFKVDKDDAGFLVVPKSHKEYKPMVNHKRNWIICYNENFTKKAIKLLIPGNCFTLWNSKLIHSNIGINNKKISLNRLTAYITFLQKHYPIKILQKKEKKHILMGKQHLIGQINVKLKSIRILKEIMKRKVLIV